MVEVRGHNTTADANAYNNAYCNVIRLENGKLNELTEYYDTALVDAELGDSKDTKLVTA